MIIYSRSIRVSLKTKLAFADVRHLIDEVRIRVELEVPFGGDERPVK